MDHSKDEINNKKKNMEENLHHQEIENRAGAENFKNDNVQPSENFVRVKKPLNPANITLVPNQFLGAQGSSPTPLNATNIIESMLRYKWTIIILTILVAVPLIAAIWTQITPKYRARAEIHVRPIIQRLVFKTDENGMIPLYTSFVNTQISIIRSPTVLQRALDQKKVQDTQWFKNPSKNLLEKIQGNTTSAMERLRDELVAKPRNGTEIIDVSLLADKGEDAKVVVDAVLEQYIKYIGEMSNETEDILYRQLTSQYNSLANQIDVQEKDLDRLRKELKTSAPQELISAKRMRLDEKREQLSEMQYNISILKNKIEQEIPDVNSTIPLPTPQQRYSQDNEWRQLDTNVRAIQHQIENTNYTDKHPKMIALKNDLKFAEDLLQRRQELLDEQFADQSKNANGDSVFVVADSNQENSIEYMKQQLALAEKEEELFKTELGKQEQEFEDLFATAQRYDDESNALIHTRELYNAVRERIDQKNIERNVPGSIDVSMWALASSQPYNDRRMVFSAMVMFLGLGLGAGVAYLRASRNQTVYAPEDVFVPEGVPLLGYVPIVNLKKPIGKSVCKEIAENQFLLNESFRVIRTVLLSRLNGHKCTTLLISSATAGTGKSTFTMMLGKSLAKTGKKILVIDADIKKRTLTRLYEHLPKGPGFIQALREPKKHEQNLFHENNLDFMPAGKTKDIDDDTFADEIANGAFKTLITELREHYDIILLDGSPILPVADSVILSGQVDGTIFVEREHVSNRTNIIDAMDRINSSQGKMIGSVFVGSKTHHKYGYDYYYSENS